MLPYQLGSCLRKLASKKSRLVDIVRCYFQVDGSSANTAIATGERFLGLCLQTRRQVFPHSQWLKLGCIRNWKAVEGQYNPVSTRLSDADVICFDSPATPSPLWAHIQTRPASELSLSRRSRVTASSKLAWRPMVVASGIPGLIVT